MANFIAVHPIIPVRDIPASIRYYGRLGFELAFSDTSTDVVMYVGLRRDVVEIHLQWQEEAHFPKEGDGIHLRFMIDDVDSLYEELAPQSVFSARTELRDTSWQTREFAFYDPDGNGLTFYRDR